MLARSTHPTPPLNGREAVIVDFVEDRGRFRCRLASSGDEGSMLIGVKMNKIAPVAAAGVVAGGPAP
jgi:hypothetical protein